MGAGEGGLPIRFWEKTLPSLSPTPSLLPSLASTSLTKPHPTQPHLIWTLSLTARQNFGAKTRVHCLPSGLTTERLIALRPNKQEQETSPCSHVAGSSLIGGTAEDLQSPVTLSRAWRQETKSPSTAHFDLNLLLPPGGSASTPMKWKRKEVPRELFNELWASVSASINF